MVDVTAPGGPSAPDPDPGGGRPGDAIYVTGSIGGAAAGLAAVKSGGDLGFADVAKAAGKGRRHRRPEPRTRIGRLLGATGRHRRAWT